MEKNLEYWGCWAIVPQEAQKQISGGRLKGMTDINPMWRLRTLTENFGPVGIGWTYEITKQWSEQGANGEIAAFCNINLKYKVDGEWSAPIPGTGGAAFVAKESKGLYTSDEAYKQALTDAISVACKALGMGADVYWKAGSTKYTKPQEEPPQMDYYGGVTPKEYKAKKQEPPLPEPPPEPITDQQLNALMDAVEFLPKLAQNIAEKFGGVVNMTREQADEALQYVAKVKAKKEAASAG